MRRLILRNGYSPGDVVMLTAAVRDLHRAYPGHFQTDVRTACPELWEHNPYLTRLAEETPGVEVLECTYPLINRANVAPYHCLHGFIEFLNGQLGLALRPTLFQGDIHLSDQEKAWYSQVYELTRRDLPFWIVSAGGKYDVTVKWWSRDRYQAVVDHFRGRIQFVQVGKWGHHHPRLEGVIDLRGRTTLRELVRLVYHAQGVLCPVTALMHLAAAVEVKGNPTSKRPCVVVAGGREPPHWEAYPGHQFLHTLGALPCCRTGGCWKDRVLPLGDGDPRDRPASRCVDVVRGLPRCLDLVTVERVIEAIELYFQGGALRALSRPEAQAASRAVARTRTNRFDQQPLLLPSARAACDDQVRAMPRAPADRAGRGIVLCAGGVRYFTNAWVCIRRLRQLGCHLPIQLWHLGPDELDPAMRRLVAPWGVECVDAERMRRDHPVRHLAGWPLKAYALVHTRLAEVLFLDADNVPTRNPEFLFDTSAFRSTGALFWPDFNPARTARALWRCLGLRPPPEAEFESGQIVVDTRRVWPALRLALWFNEHADFFYRHVHGDKETFHLAFRRLRQPYTLIPHPVRALPGTMCQHDFDGRPLFLHRNLDKWNLFLRNRRVPGFEGEPACRRFVRELRRSWDGRLARVVGTRPARPTPARHAPRFLAVMISCPERDALRAATVGQLARTDWGEAPLVVQLKAPHAADDPQRNQTRTARLALERGLASGAEYLLFLEDDLEFNRHLRHNLTHWAPIRDGRLTLGSLYNPGLRELACDVPGAAVVVAPDTIYGSQAFVLSRATARHVLRHWSRVAGLQDIRISRLAARLRHPIYYHAPSLIQHVGRVSLWGGGFHQAVDFDPDWRAPRSRGGPPRRAAHQGPGRRYRDELTKHIAAAAGALYNPPV